MADLIEEVPGGLERYRPQMRYCLLDEGRLAKAKPAPLRNLAAALFRLETSRKPADVRRVVKSLIKWLRSPEQSSLQEAFTVWLNRVLARRMPDGVIPWMANLTEVDTVLEERVEEWTRQWKQQGLAKGLKKGLEKGLKKGLKKGRMEGRREGRVEGLERGRREGQEKGRKAGRKEGWKEGQREGRDEALARLRKVLLQEVEARFGTPSEEVLGKVTALDSVSDIAGLIARVATAPSLRALGLE